MRNCFLLLVGLICFSENYSQMPTQQVSEAKITDLVIKKKAPSADDKQKKIPEEVIIVP